MKVCAFCVLPHKKAAMAFAMAAYIKYSRSTDLLPEAVPRSVNSHLFSFVNQTNLLIVTIGWYAGLL